MNLNKANGPRTVLSLSAVGLTVAILAASIWVQSATSAGGGGSKGPKKVPHHITFGGDIQGATAQPVDLDPDKPLNNVSLDDFVVTFVNVTVGHGCCGDDCDGFAMDWGGYAVGEWTGPMTIRKTRQGGSIEWFIGYFEGTNGAGSINLAIHAVPDFEDPAYPAKLVFQDARGAVSGPSSPDGGDPDGLDRCLTFTITATKL